jgi:methionine--tRNA ligase beta chain
LTKTWHHPESDKLWCEEIDVGEPTPRQVCSGLRAFYTEEQFKAGRKVVVVCNLKPAKMAGFESAGMVLCAANAEHTKVHYFTLYVTTLLTLLYYSTLLLY